MSESKPSEDAKQVSSSARHGRPLSRRAFLGSLGSAAVGVGAYAAGTKLASSDAPVTGGTNRDSAEPFYALRQGGISSPPQSNTYFAAFDVSTERRSELEALLREWSSAASRLTRGLPERPLGNVVDLPEPDSGDALSLGAARLTVTFGVCPGLFERDGVDRYGLANRRPAALVELPRFPNDHLIADKTGGDLTIQACADDPQVAFHAVRELARLGDGVVTVRWSEAGYNETAASNGTPRNLMGFKDGTVNPRRGQLERFVWVGAEGPAWMRGGTYLVARRIRIALEHWDTESLEVQQQVIGREKRSGAPLGEKSEFSPLNLRAYDRSGNPLIPIDAHVRLSAPQLNGGEMILRRSYAYNDGVDRFAERWPPWQQAMLYDAGLLFCAYQRDPRKGFIAIFNRLAENDALGQFTTHTGSVIAAIPPGAARPGHFVGEELFT